MASLSWMCLIAVSLMPSLEADEDFYQQGKQAMEAKEYDKAIAAFTKAIKANTKAVYS